MAEVARTFLVFFIPPRTIQQREESFFPLTISKWNRLPQPIVLNRSVGTFPAVASSIKL
jgi:hypothetical protein